MATATGPITIPRINYTYTVGQGFLNSIQRAVTYAMTATGYGDVIIPQGYQGTDSPASVNSGSNLVFIIDTRNGQRKIYAWSGSAYVLQPLTADSAVFTSLEANAANFDSCIVHDSPVRTFANTPGGGDIAMVWPEFGVPISEGDHWRDPSIDPANLPLLNQDNTFQGNITAASLNASGDIYTNGNLTAVLNVHSDSVTTRALYVADVSTSDTLQTTNLAAAYINCSGNADIGGTLTAAAGTFSGNIATLTGSVSGINIVANGVVYAGNPDEGVPDSDTRRWRLSLHVAGQSGYTYPGQFLFATQTSGENPANDQLSLWHTSIYPNAGEYWIGSFSRSGISFNGNVNTNGTFTANGNLTVNGSNIYSNNIQNNANIQTNTLTAATQLWTVDIHAGGTVQTVNLGADYLNVTGNADISGTLTAGAKNFRIVHPSNKKKYLIHSCLEGPEVAVFYRGEGQTKNYKATIKLPAYFESLVAKDNRTVQLTAILDEDEDEAFGFLAAGRVIDGKFKVHSSEETQKFYWEVKAIRGDLPPLDVEPDIPKEKKAA